MAANGYTHELERLGETGSISFIGPQWARVSATPGSGFKFYTHEGGVRVPLIISGADVKSGIVDAPAFAIDIVPTLLARAGIDSREAPSLDGINLGGWVFSGAVFPDPERKVGLEVSGNAAFYRGDFKIARNAHPEGDGLWHLYNIAQDPAESIDLSQSQKAVLHEMIAGYAEYQRENGVLEMPDNYAIEKQIVHNTNRRLLTRYWPFALLLFSAISGSFVFLLTARRRKAKRRATETNR
jgi:arylsulfatase A-like enzyme